MAIGDDRGGPAAWAAWALGGLFVAGMALLLVAGCSVEERYAVLTFFFDDVPDPFAKPAAEGADAGDAALSPKAPAPNPVVVHAPYREKECASCHPPDRFVSRRGSREPGFCFACHEEQKRLFEGYRYAHGPAAVDACLDCHAPHQSRHVGLTVSPDPDLCYRCHDDRKALLSRPAHDERIEDGCLPCHDPHGGGDRFFLRGETDA